MNICLKAEVYRRECSSFLEIYQNRIMQRKIVFFFSNLSCYRISYLTMFDTN